MEVPSEDGIQKTLYLPLKFLNGWLFKINAARYKNKIQQERIIQYQLECYDALYNYWHKGGVEFLAEELLDYKKDSDRWFKAWDEVAQCS